MLVAYSLGLGTVWVGAFNEKEVSKILTLPDHLRPVAIIPVGYPAESPSRPGKVPREESIVYIR
jgi:nitroreductase